MRRVAIAAALALLAGCDVTPEKPAKPAPTAAATPAKTVAAAVSPAARLAQAVRAVPAANGSRYTFDGDDKLIDTAFGPVLLRHGHVADAGHAEAGVVAAYYLRAEGNGFALASAYPEAATSGSFGDLGKWSVSTDFSTLPVLVVEGGGTWQGCTVASTDLVELRPTGPVSLASVMTTFDDSGMVEDGAQSFAGSFADIVRDHSFTVQYKGTRSFAERYVRRGDRFQLEGGESQVPGC